MQNKILLRGNIGKEIKVNTAKEYCYFSIAVNKGTKDNPKTDWHDIIAFGPWVKRIAKDLAKGEWVDIEGDYSKDFYETKSGETVSKPKIVAKNIYPVKYRLHHQMKDTDNFTEENVPF